MKLEFYKCAHCGNVAVKLFDQGVPLSCCGEEMTLLRAGETDGAAEKHVPVVTVGETIHVEVGSVLHPMMEAHFITMIVLETSKGFQVKHLQPGEEPKADFAVVPGEEPVAVYEYCNLHGLWKADVQERVAKLAFLLTKQTDRIQTLQRCTC